MKSKIIFKKKWGEVSFDSNGLLNYLTLKYGSRKSLITSTRVISSNIKLFDCNKNVLKIESSSLRVKQKTNKLVVSGVFRKDDICIPYHIEWLISDIGFVKVSFQIDIPKNFKGNIKYIFPFNTKVLPSYYYGSFYPKVESSLKRKKLKPTKQYGICYQLNKGILGKVLGLCYPNRETLNILPVEAILDDLMLKGGKVGIVIFSQSIQNMYNINKAVFYILPAPVAQSKGFKRAICAQHGIISSLGPKIFVKKVKQMGFRYIIYHHEWQLPQKNWSSERDVANVQFGSHQPRCPQLLKKLLIEAHRCKLKVLVYFGFCNENLDTPYAKKQWQSPWKLENRPRKIMCTNSGYWQHQLKDLDRIFNTYMVDGIFVDWFSIVPCNKSTHNHHYPVNNIKQMIELVLVLKKWERLLFIHPSEEHIIPFFFDLVDSVAIGERPWSDCNFETIKTGLFQRWSTQAGRFGIIYNQPDIEIGINAAFFIGLNPFGYICVSDEQKKSIVFNPKLMELLKVLKPYPLEEMKIYPADSNFVKCNNREIAVTCLFNRKLALIFAINCNSKKGRDGQITFPKFISQRIKVTLDPKQMHIFLFNRDSRSLKKIY